MKVNLGDLVSKKELLDKAVNQLNYPGTLYGELKEVSNLLKSIISDLKVSKKCLIEIRRAKKKHERIVLNRMFHSRDVLV